jgi:hypothetical protein
MKLAKVIVGSVMLALAPLAATAEDMSYSYVDVNWVSLDADILGESVSADGFGLNGSIAFAENFFGFVDYRTVEGDEQGFNFDIDQISVGLGGRYGISESADLVGRIGYTQADASVEGLGSDDVDGYLLSVGARGQLTESFELEGYLNYTDLGDNGDDTSFAVDARYFFTKQFAVDAGIETGDDVDVWNVGVRFAF